MSFFFILVYSIFDALKLFRKACFKMYTTRVYAIHFYKHFCMQLNNFIHKIINIRMGSQNDRHILRLYHECLYFIALCVLKLLKLTTQKFVTKNLMDAWFIKRRDASE